MGCHLVVPGLDILTFCRSAGRPRTITLFGERKRGRLCEFLRVSSFVFSGEITRLDRAPVPRCLYQHLVEPQETHRLAVFHLVLLLHECSSEGVMLACWNQQAPRSAIIPMAPHSCRHEIVSRLRLLKESGSQGFTTCLTLRLHRIS